MTTWRIMILIDATHQKARQATQQIEALLQHRYGNIHAITIQEWTYQQERKLNIQPRHPTQPKAEHTAQQKPRRPRRGAE